MPEHYIDADDLPADIRDLIGKIQYVSQAGAAASSANVRAMCAAVENGNPVYWDEAAATTLLGTPYCPATLLPAWGRPELWEPGTGTPLKALQAHYDLKNLLGLPASIAVSYTTTFYTAVKLGDRFRTQQVVRQIGAIKTTKLGTGRFWTIEMQYLDDRDRVAGIECYEFFGFQKEAA